MLVPDLIYDVLIQLPKGSIKHLHNNSMFMSRWNQLHKYKVYKNGIEIVYEDSTPVQAKIQESFYHLTLY